MRGLFQRYQMTFTTLFCFQILVADKTVGVVRINEFFQLLRCPRSMAMANPAPAWLTDSCWGAAAGLASLGWLQITRTRYHNAHRTMAEILRSRDDSKREMTACLQKQQQFPEIAGNSLHFDASINVCRLCDASIRLFP
jgi:hypothetical protein